MPEFQDPVKGKYDQSVGYAVQGEVPPGTTAGNIPAVQGIDHGPLGWGVAGESDHGTGVYGKCLDPNGYGVRGESPNWAGYFEGPTMCHGLLQVTGEFIPHPQAKDCAEDFDIAEENVDAGTVMVLNDKGSLQPSYTEYDKKVAGIVSGAGELRPAMVLGREGREQSQSQNQKKQDRLPIALMGKVYCKVDARHSSIEIGDLLTTSFTKGYAMKAEDPLKAFGTVIGKALGSIKEGLGMIPVLVALQ